MSIAAPSRVAKRSDGPLDGMRTAVKDMFEINGLTTTLCNRAFYEISRPSNTTAACVRKLVDAGVHVLGTTKISSMISREEPTEAIDYHPPFNPRADGYQSPAGSSSGSGAAMAAYKWLDFTIAEDTSGSGRRPAAANGVFQYRPTHDLMDLDGMWPTFLPFDTPVILSRDLNIITSIAPLWCDLEAALSPPKPLCILYPEEYLPTDNEAHLHHVDSFVDDLRSASNGTIERFSIAQKWHDSCPQGCSRDIKEYLGDVIVQTFYHGFYHSQSSFRNKYFEIHQKQPFVNSFVKWRWDLGSSVTEDQNREGLHRLKVYKSWFLERVLKGWGEHTVLVMPISEGKPNYRDHPPTEPTVQNGFDSLFLSPILGCPDLVIPIAQVDYHSKISGRTERLPICVNVIGMPGRDLDLIEVTRNTLQDSGRPSAVQVGSDIFKQ